MITFVGYSERYDQRKVRRLANVFNPPLPAVNIQCAPPAAGPRLLMLRRVCHYYSAELPTHCLIKLQFRDRLRIRTHRGRPLIIPAFCYWVCRLVKLNFGIASTASGAISCCAFTSTGGERAGAIAGAVVGMFQTVPFGICVCSGASASR